MNTSKHRSQRDFERAVSVLEIFLVVLVGLTAMLSLLEGRGGGNKGGYTAAVPDVPSAASVPDVPETTSAAPKLDSAPPVIHGVTDLYAYMGSPVSYLSGITATDDTDPAPALTVDSSAVDLSRAGTYRVVYTAADSAGNRTSAETTVTVLNKKEGSVELETIYAVADRKLERILTDGMTTREQVEAIYKWARSSLAYSGHSDKSDWLQAAYRMLTEGEGDCFSYFAVTKLMFVRLGIPNIDVQKARNFDTDSDHYWSLVSVDGGETYYHFDATPRKGSGDDFCLVTDKFLDAYSKAHKNCHNRDKSRYPATPEG